MGPPHSRQKRTQEMRRFFAAAACMLVLAGCAPVYWSKPGFSQAEWNRDSYECERDVRQTSHGTGLVGALDAMAFEQDCLRAHGYYRVSR